MRYLLLLLLCLLPTVAQAQRGSQVSGDLNRGSYEEFVTVFQGAKDLDEPRLDEIYRSFGLLLTPGSDVTQLRNQLAGEPSVSHPLAGLKELPDYEARIKELLTSKSQFDRILAYAVLSAANDSSHNSFLLKAMQTESERVCRVWAGIALLHLGAPYTEPLFDFIVAEEEFRDPHMMVMFLKFPPDVLRDIGIQKIDSQELKPRILAVQCLIAGGSNPKSIQLLREKVSEWELPSKGYAIYALRELKEGGLKNLLEPYLSDPKLTSLVLSSLANSPTAEDQDVLTQLMEDELSEELLDAFQKSRQPRMVKKWLSLLRERDLPDGYQYFIYGQPLLKSDEVLPDLLQTLEQAEEPEMLAKLVPALEGRQDERSLNLLLGLLEHPEHDVRYWTAEALKDTRSPRLAAVLPKLLRDKELRSTALTHLAIQHSLADLHDVFAPILATDSPRDWRRSSVEYIAAFPRSEDAAPLRQLLSNPEEDVFIQREAAIGLGRLHDEESVDLIIAALRREPASDHNALSYLVALSGIKGKKSLAVIESYRESSNPQVKQLVESILSAWAKNP